MPIVLAPQSEASLRGDASIKWPSISALFHNLKLPVSISGANAAGSVILLGVQAAGCAWLRKVLSG